MDPSTPALRRAARLPPLALVMLASLALAGCTSFDGACAGSQGASGQQGVCNERDSFAYGLQGVKTGTETYRWENTGSAAQVTYGVQGDGSVRLRIQDAAGKEVLDGSFTGGQEGDSQRTSSGQPGMWTITMTFQGFRGQGVLSVARA